MKGDKKNTTALVPIKGDLKDFTSKKDKLDGGMPDDKKDEPGDKKDRLDGEILCAVTSSEFDVDFSQGL